MTTRVMHTAPPIAHAYDETSTRPVKRNEPGSAVPCTRVTLDNLTLSRKEGFQARAEAPKRNQPDLLTVRALGRLGCDARGEYDEQRSVWHANLPAIETSQLVELREEIADIVASNRQDGDKAKGAIAIEGSAGIGKTYATLEYAYSYHKNQIGLNGPMTADGNERWPVCRVGMSGNTGIKDFNRAMLGFYNHAGTQRGTAVDFANRALDCVLSCETTAVDRRRTAFPQAAHHQCGDQQPVQIHQQRISGHHHLHRHRATTARPLQ